MSDPVIARCAMLGPGAGLPRKEQVSGEVTGKLAMDHLTIRAKIADMR